MILYLELYEVQTEPAGSYKLNTQTIIADDAAGRLLRAEWLADPTKAAIIAAGGYIQVHECLTNAPCQTRELLESGVKSYAIDSMTDQITTKVAALEADLVVEPIPDTSVLTLAQVKIIQKRIVRYQARVYFAKKVSPLEMSLAIQAGVGSNKWNAWLATTTTVNGAKQAALDAIDAAATKAAVRLIDFVPPV